MAQLTIQQAFDLGLHHHRAGNLREAELVYRQILAREPDQVDALHHLGLIARQVGRNDAAMECFQRVVQLHPNFAEAQNNLGNLLKDLGRTDEAIAVYQLAISLKANLPEAHYNLGSALKEKGRLDEAIAAFQRSIQFNPNLPEAHNNLAIALKEKGRLAEAIVACRQAIQLRPNYAEAHGNLGNLLKETGQIDEAIRAFELAVALKPELPEAHYNLGGGLKETERLDEAIKHFHQSIAMNPNLAEAHNNLALAFRDIGLIDDAVASLHKAIAVNPKMVEAQSNLLYTIHNHPGYDARAIADAHRRWNQIFAEPLGKDIQMHRNDRSPGRRLRIGYVSGDFRDHVVARFLLPLLEHHDHSAFEIFFYSNTVRTDAKTARFQSLADRWREIVGVSDEDAAGQIRADAIDILVDLAGHTSGNRLLVFARKPAPVQVSYLGYPDTTGLRAMDYRLTDHSADPEGMTDHLHSEKLIRLPQTNWCVEEPQQAPPVEPPPSIGRGCVTFGSFNSFAKVTAPMLLVWGKMLKAVPKSRLLLKSHGLGSGSAHERVLKQFAEQGIDLSRLELRGPEQGQSRHLALYHQMDIALDTFPYNGTTTTCDALWMGVPVITLAGQTHVSRVGASLLASLGLSELVATNSDDYVKLAIQLAADRERLISLRQNLRDRMKQSPLMDAPAFAKNIESAYRQMWRAWCEKDSVAG